MSIKFECTNCGRLHEKFPMKCEICGRTIFRSKDRKHFNND